MQGQAPRATTRVAPTVLIVSGYPAKGMWGYYGKEKASIMGSRDMKKWETSISKIVSEGDEEDVIIRGHSLNDLIGEVTFSEMMFLLIKGELPSKGQAKVLDALLVASMEHGIAPPSMMSRCLASYGSPIQAAIAGGVLAFGDYMGGAGEQFARMMVDSLEALNGKPTDIDQETLRDEAKRIVEDSLKSKHRIAGFGIPFHGEDPRSPILLKIAREERVFGTYCRFAQLIGEELGKSFGKPIPMNLDGVGGAIILDLGFPWESARMFIITPRIVSMGALNLEELG